MKSKEQYIANMEQYTINKAKQEQDAGEWTLLVLWKTYREDSRFSLTVWMTSVLEFWIIATTQESDDVGRLCSWMIT